jgi:hypothetical protein
MNFPRFQKLACPYCHRVYAKTLSTVYLGPGTQCCRRCHRHFGDGSIEWPVASRSEKMEFFFPVVLRAFVIMSLVFETALAFTQRPDWHGVIVLVILGAVITIFPVLMYLLVCKLQIRLSVIRYEKRILADAGYAGTTAGMLP